MVSMHLTSTPYNADINIKEAIDAKYHNHDPRVCLVCHDGDACSSNIAPRDSE